MAPRKSKTKSKGILRKGLGTQEFGPDVGIEMNIRKTNTVMETNLRDNQEQSVGIIHEESDDSESLNSNKSKASKSKKVVIPVKKFTKDTHIDSESNLKVDKDP